MRTLAYLDPGSSSVILQMIAGGVAAAGVAARLFWARILRFLHIGRDNAEDDASAKSDSP